MILTDKPGLEDGFLDGGGRAVLVVSPQPWQGLKVSKHHYAAELAALGHRVWFLEPPRTTGRSGSLEIVPTETPGVSRVLYSPTFPYWIKFHARWLFDRLMSREARRIADAIGERLDLVWDFDNAYQFSDLRPFGARLSIFHPVDGLIAGKTGDKSCDVLLSVAQTFLDRIAGGERGHVMPHALSRAHEARARRVAAEPERAAAGRTVPRVAYVGNLEHVGVDWPTLLAMARRCPHAELVLIGPYNGQKDTGAASNVPLAELRALGNCSLPGPMPAADILAMADDVDLWLVCYDVRKTGDGAINSHKILEYLATGNPVLSNRIAAYVGSDLVEMAEQADNSDLPDRLDAMLQRMLRLQDPALRRRRAERALELTYEESLRRIDQLCREASGRAEPRRLERGAS